MSQQPLPHRSPRSASAQPGREGDGAWIVGFILAAEIGGLAAAAVTHGSMLRAVAIPLVVAAVVVGVLWTGALDRRLPAGRRAESPGRGQPAAPGATRATARHGGSPSGGQSAAGAEELAARDAAPRPAAARDSQPYAWSWPLSGGGPDSAAAGPPADGPGPVRPGVVTVLPDQATNAGSPRATDLAQFLGQVVIAQCPQCAAFRVSADTQPQDWLFACHDCGWQWTWRPGTPWPDVHVRPDERRRSGRRSS
jgi:hypothetical protein